MEPTKQPNSQEDIPMYTPVKEISKEHLIKDRKSDNSYQTIPTSDKAGTEELYAEVSPSHSPKHGQPVGSMETNSYSPVKQTSPKKHERDDGRSKPNDYEKVNLLPATKSDLYVNPQSEMKDSSDPFDGVVSKHNDYELMCCQQQKPSDVYANPAQSEEIKDSSDYDLVTHPVKIEQIPPVEYSTVNKAQQSQQLSNYDKVADPPIKSIPEYSVMNKSAKKTKEDPYDMIDTSVQESDLNRPLLEGKQDYEEINGLIPGQSNEPVNDIKKPLLKSEYEDINDYYQGS